MTRPERLRARVAQTLADLQGEPRPRGPNAQQLAALDLVLPQVSPARADDLIDAWGEHHLRACLRDVEDDPAIAALLRRPLTPRLRAALLTLPGDLPDAPDLLTLHDRSWFAGSHPPPGLSAWQRPDLLARLAAGVDPDLLIDRHLAAWALHTTCRGPARGWAGGWPCWTLQEAAVTHVHRRAAPEHLFPDTPGGALPGMRHFAMIGAYLSLWLGEEATTRLALQATGPHDVWGERVGHLLSTADLQAWLNRGGAALGPAWSDPFAWLKLLAAALFGGPALPADPSAELPDLLAAAAALDWHALPVSRREEDPSDALQAAVAAMFAEDITLRALHAAPSDPPGGELVLDVEACTLSARPRAHLQYTEPARWLVPPSWAADLRRRGLRRLVLTGCCWERQGEVLAALHDLRGALPVELQRHLGPKAVVPTPPAALQVRQHDVLLSVGCRLSDALGERLRLARFELTPSPFGVTPDPLGAARALHWSTSAAPLPREVLAQDEGRWRSRWHDPSWTWTRRADAFAALDARLDAARAAVRRLRLLLLSWETAWVDDRLLPVEEIVTATRAALQELRQHVAAPRVVLLLSPALDPGRSAADNHASKATLLLAARALGEEVDVLPAWEIFAQELRDHRWYAEDGHALTAAAHALLLDRLLDTHVAPVSREHARDLLAGRPPGPHPFLPPAAAAAAEPEPTALGDDLSTVSWRAALETLLAQEPATDARLAWTRRLEEVLERVGALPDAPAQQLELLRAFVESAGEIDDPDLIAPSYAQVLGELLPLHPAATLAPLLRVALQRRWVEDAAPLVATLDDERRHELGRALLDGKAPPKKGQPLRTPLERCVGVLLG